MASLKVTFKPSVEKDLQNLPRAVVSRIVDRTQALAEEPFPPGSRRLASTARLYRIRVGDYRIIYEVNSEAGLLLIHYIRHRREVYRRIR
jgi:mRNA interferase RelE/StbE